MRTGLPLHLHHRPRAIMLHPLPPILYPRARVVGLTTNGRRGGRSLQPTCSPLQDLREALVCGSASTPSATERQGGNDLVEALRRGRYGAAGSPGHLRCTVLHSRRAAMSGLPTCHALSTHPGSGGPWIWGSLDLGVRSEGSDLRGPLDPRI